MNFGEALFRRSSVNVSSSLKTSLIVCFGFGAAIVVVVCVVVVVGCRAAVVVVWSVVVVVGSDGLIASGGKRPIDRGEVLVKESEDALSIRQALVVVFGVQLLYCQEVD